MTHAEAGRPNSGGGTTLHEETERECRAQAAAEIRAPARSDSRLPRGADVLGLAEDTCPCCLCRYP